jgi:hypothetical protein
MAAKLQERAVSYANALDLIKYAGSVPIQIASLTRGK